jgi:hypothetical protein
VFIKIFLIVIFAVANINIFQRTLILEIFIKSCVLGAERRSIIPEAGLHRPKPG